MFEKVREYKKYFIPITFAIVLYLALSHLMDIMGVLSYFIKILTPIITGLIVAYILNILVNVFENRVFRKLWGKHPKIARFKRVITVFLTLLCVIILLALLLLFIIPQVVQSFQLLASNIPGYLQNVSQWVEQIAIRYNISIDLWDQVATNWKEIFNSVSGFVKTAMPQIYDVTKGVTNGIYNFTFGIVIAIYLLFEKEKLIRICKKLLYAVSQKKTAQKTFRFLSDANHIFSKYIGGQLTDSLILGTLCVLGLLLLRVPYALLIGVIVGFTSLIPIVGTYIGIITSGLILLMVNPVKTLWFIIFIIILQQIDNNFIYPRVVGNAVGISGLFIIIAIIIGGSLFGVLGMIVSIPLCSVLYATIRSSVNRRLKTKEITIE